MDGGLFALIAVNVIIVLYVANLKHKKDKEILREKAKIKAKAQHDSLRMIKGVSPHICEVLQQAGVKTLDQLAVTEVSRLREILNEAGIASLADPATWPEQARLAVVGEMEELQKLQDKI